jgi:hypothetical protein
MHAGNGQAHDGGGHQCAHAGVAMGVLQSRANDQRQVSQNDRHHHRQADDADVIAQQRGRLHRGHAGIVHGADAGAHQYRANHEHLL